MKIRNDVKGRRKFISMFCAAAAIIKPIDGVIVGMFPWSFNEIIANSNYARELGV